MIHGYHVVWGTYGFWLPNDPRGSWSDFVYAWELARFGAATKSVERQEVDAAKYATWRTAARTSLAYQPVTLSGEQAQSVGSALGAFVRKSRLCVWACSILPEHIHLVLARHRYRIEQAVKLLKGAATTRLFADGRHPMSHCQKTDQDRLPSAWAEGHWKVYLDSEEAIENAIRYVGDNPVKEEKPAQRWSFVTPFQGIDTAGVNSYY
jgi:REP element-mobilizing transposase RayT